MWGKEELGWWARRHGGRGKFSQNAIYEKIMKILKNSTHYGLIISIKYVMCCFLIIIMNKNITCTCIYTIYFYLVEGNMLTVFR